MRGSGETGENKNQSLEAIKKQQDKTHGGGSGKGGNKRNEKWRRGKEERKEAMRERGRIGMHFLPFPPSVSPLPSVPPLRLPGRTWANIQVRGNDCLCSVGVPLRCRMLENVSAEVRWQWQ